MTRLVPCAPAEMAEYCSLLEELAENITREDLDQLKSACKEDIPSEKSEEIATSKDWFSFLEKHNKLDKGERAGRGPVPSPCPFGRAPKTAPAAAA